jgi:hypothetical protein
MYIKILIFTIRHILNKVGNDQIYHYLRQQQQKAQNDQQQQKAQNDQQQHHNQFTLQYY